IDYGAARVNWTGADGIGFGQFMLTPYHTNKDLNQVHPIGTTWYDDVIVSTQPIPMLNGVIPMADTTPPSVTNVAASNITSNGATITWTSSEPANSQVEYGLTASYGIQSSLDTSLVTSHSVTLSNLLPGTVYNYRAKSGDIAGNVATSDGLTFTTTSGASTASPLTNGLTGYWALDEGSGTTTADLSGNNNNGTLINNPLWITGKVGKALQFNATDNNNDTDDPRVWIGRNFDIPGFPFTLSAWVNPTDFTDYRAIFSKRDSDSTSAKRFDLGLSIGTGRVYINSSTPRNFIYAPPTNTWTHLAIVASSTDAKLYVNGALQETIAAFTLGTGANANTAIGGTGEALTGDDDPFKGSIDEVRVYNRALTPSEIQLARDINPPVISGVNTSNITSFGAMVTWTTDERADSQVDYGTTSSYGQSTPLDTSLLTGHGLNLSGLSSSTTYHFGVKSRDAARNLATSQDYTFTTAAPPLITLSPATLPDPTAGVAYNQTITASGGFSPSTFGVLTGSLPPGLTLNASTGTITGTPTTAGAASFTIQAVDSLGYPGNRSYTVNTANLISDNVYLTLTSRTYDSEPSTDPPLVGRLSLSFNMTNMGPPITSAMYFIVTDLYKLFGDQNPDQPDLLLSADNHAGTMGDRQTLITGPLQTNQTAPVSFLIGIGSRQPFEFYVDLYTSADGSPLTASDSGILKTARDNAPGTLLGRFKFTVSEAAPTQTVKPPGPFVSVPPGSNAGAAGNVGVIIGPGPQSRPSVAVDPVLSEHMAVASNDYATRTVRISTTPDGGATWYSTMLGRTLGNQTFFAAQNPSLAFDSLGRLSVVYTLSNLNDSSNAIVISESSDGINFNPPAAISFHLASEQVIDSRPVVAIKSGAGRYVAWDSLSLATSRYSINLVRSEEGGLFGPVTTVVNNDLVSSVALALNKSRVYIGWDNWGFNSVAPYKTGGSLMVTSSPNGTQFNFAVPQELARTSIGFGQRIPAMPEKGVRPNLSLAADPKDDSRVYAVFTDRGNGMDVRLGGSADQGKTWQVVAVGNDDTLADQFDPAIGLDSNSNPYISFYDTRLSSTFEAADLFLATLSTGNSFDAQRLSTVSSNDSQKNPQRD
ncbi:MAG TPA: LamG-like jellyroll fold domain-containing protein, partial [Terriglobia bacterium]|nr:LamG-like jellyroll fold domain-containing protein [Terriglobia bacterium]